MFFVMIGWLYYRNFSGDYNLFAVKALLALVLLEIVAGVVLYYLHVPAIVQPIHLFLSTLMFAFWGWAVLRTRTD